MTAEELKSLIAAGLACEHLTLEGDGRHWYATIVSARVRGQAPIQRHQRSMPRWAQECKTDEVHALSMKTYTPAEWAGPIRLIS
jgi:acid stress-induced BolA-like protein IbaG/YrbA